MTLKAGASMARACRPVISLNNTPSQLSRAIISQSSTSSLPLPAPHAVHQLQHVRRSSHSPMGAGPANARKKVTIGTLRSQYRKGDRITMMTAHDFPSAHVADHAGMDVVLVGDSLAMVALGMEDTSEILLEEMILHCRSVSRATKAAFTVCSSHGVYSTCPKLTNVF